MSAFEYFVLVIAIPLGLAVVEIAQGISSSLRRRKTIHIGFLTPLLVLILIQMLAISWFEIFLYEARFELGIFEVLIALLASCSIYVAASFAFPPNLEDGMNLDEWFMENRRISLGLTVVIFLVIDTIFLAGNTLSAANYEVIIFTALLFLPLALSLVLKGRRAVLISLLLANIPFLAIAAGEAIS